MGNIELKSKNLESARQKLDTASTEIALQADTLKQVLSILEEGAWLGQMEAFFFAEAIKWVRKKVKDNSSDFSSAAKRIKSAERSARLVESVIIDMTKQ